MIKPTKYHRWYDKSVAWKILTFLSVKGNYSAASDCSQHRLAFGKCRNCYALPQHEKLSCNHSLSIWPGVDFLEDELTGMKYITDLRLEQEKWAGEQTRTWHCPENSQLHTTQKGRWCWNTAAASIWKRQSLVQAGNHTYRWWNELIYLSFSNWYIL